MASYVYETIEADCLGRQRRVDSRAIRVALALSLGVVACGRSTKDPSELPTIGGSGPELPSEDGAGQGQGMSPGPAVPCVEGMPTADELASTPRQHVDLELLALKVSPGIVAEAAAYDRVVHDVSAIKSMQPELADISHLSRSDGREILLNVESTTYFEMTEGHYSAWKCLNEVYGFEQAQYLDFGAFNAFVTLEGIYRLERVAAHYATLPGVVMASPAGGGSDGSTICLTREDSTWHYVFDRGSGDCLAGCIEHEYRHFTSDADGNVVSLGTLPPEQVATYASDAACH